MRTGDSCFRDDCDSVDLLSACRTPSTPDAPRFPHGQAFSPMVRAPPTVWQSGMRNGDEQALGVADIQYCLILVNICQSSVFSKFSSTVHASIRPSLPLQNRFPVPNLAEPPDTRRSFLPQRRILYGGCQSCSSLPLLRLPQRAFKHKFLKKFKHMIGTLLAQLCEHPRYLGETQHEEHSLHHGCRGKS